MFKKPNFPVELLSIPNIGVLLREKETTKGKKPLKNNPNNNNSNTKAEYAHVLEELGLLCLFGVCYKLQESADNHDTVLYLFPSLGEPKGIISYFYLNKFLFIY